MKSAAGGYAAAVVLLGTLGPAQADDRCGQALRPYAATLVDRVVLGAEALAKRIEARDLAGAQRAWIQARAGWGRGEPFLAPYFPDAVAEINAWPDAETGFHALEPILFIDEDVEGAGDLARRLVGDSLALRRQLEAAELEARGLMAGLITAAADLARVKAAGGESPLARTSLDDMSNRLQGIEAVYALSFAALTRARQPALHARIMINLIELGAALRAPSILEIEDAAVFPLSESLHDAFQEMALLVELEGTELREETAPRRD
jgi:iron uptake system component EfeO